jgi:hypothetical protein
MQLFLLVSFILVCVGTAVVGARLVTAGLKSRKAPELAYGSSLLLMPIGAIIRLVVFGVYGGGAEYHDLIIAAGVSRLLTLMTLAWGILVIFRPGVLWAQALTLAYWLGGAASLAIVVAYPGAFEQAGPIYQLGDALAGAVAAWGAAESFSYFGKMKKRLALGLSDPVTTARFQLWGVAFAFASAAGMIVAIATIVLGAPITTAPSLLAIVQVCLLVTTACTWFAFYPPAWLRARLRERDPITSTG